MLHHLALSYYPYRTWIASKFYKISEALEHVVIAQWSSVDVKNNLQDTLLQNENILCNDPTPSNTNNYMRWCPFLASYDSETNLLIEPNQSPEQSLQNNSCSTWWIGFGDEKRSMVTLFRPLLLLKKALLEGTQFEGLRVSWFVEWGTSLAMSARNWIMYWEILN